MIREDHICEFCDAEYTIESEVEEVISFCPYCGSEIEYTDGDEYSDEDDDWDEDE